MPRLVDVCERAVDLSDAVLSLAGEGGLASVTLRAVAQRAGLTLTQVRHARPSRDRLLHLVVAKRAKFRARRRRDVCLRSDDPVERFVDCWLPAHDGEVEGERGWQAFRWALPQLPPATGAFLAADDADLRDMCAGATGSTSAALLLGATAEGLDAAVVRGSIDLPTARALLADAVRTARTARTAQAAHAAQTAPQSAPTQPAPGG